jgi:Protein of unknown function (DUF3684)
MKRMLQSLLFPRLVRMALNSWHDQERYDSPGLHSGSSCSSPSQVFVDPGCAVLGFAIVKPEIRDDALGKLKLLLHPPAAVALSSLLNSPPKTPEAAIQTFEYMTNLLGCMFPLLLILTAITDIYYSFHRESAPPIKQELYYTSCCSWIPGY